MNDEDYERKMHLESPNRFSSSSSSGSESDVYRCQSQVYQSNYKLNLVPQQRDTQENSFSIPFEKMNTSKQPFQIGFDNKLAIKKSRIIDMSSNNGSNMSLHASNSKAKT